MSESDLKVLVDDLIRMVELKSLGDIAWRANFQQRIVLFAQENYRTGYQDGWEEAWAIAD